MAGGFSILKENIKKFKEYLSDKYSRKANDIVKNYDYVLKIKKFRY